MVKKNYRPFKGVRKAIANSMWTKGPYAGKKVVGFYYDPVTKTKVLTFSKPKVRLKPLQQPKPDSLETQRLIDRLRQILGQDPLTEGLPERDNRGLPRVNLIPHLGETRKKDGSDKRDRKKKDEEKDKKRLPKFLKTKEPQLLEETPELWKKQVQTKLEKESVRKRFYC